MDTCGERDALVQVMVAAASKERWETVDNIVKLLQGSFMVGDGAYGDQQIGSFMTVNELGDRKWHNTVGELHCLDGLAVEDVTGRKLWWVDKVELSESQFNARCVVKDSGDDEAVPVGHENGSILTTDWRGTKEWRNTKGQLHRTDGPAVECFDGSKQWWVDGERHRTNGPAMVKVDGGKEWWLRGLRHRIGAPAVVGIDGTKEWWQNGALHRTDGPAIDFPDGFRAWYVLGLRHREDGPAVVRPDGSKEWWVKDEQLTEPEFKERFGTLFME